MSRKSRKELRDFYCNKSLASNVMQEWISENLYLTLNKYKIASS